MNKFLAIAGGALLFLGGVAVSVAVLTRTKVGAKAQTIVSDVVSKVPVVGSGA